MKLKARRDGDTFYIRIPNSRDRCYLNPDRVKWKERRGEAEGVLQGGVGERTRRKGGGGGQVQVQIAWKKWEGAGSRDRGVVNECVVVVCCELEKLCCVCVL